MAKQILKVQVYPRKQKAKGSDRKSYSIRFLHANGKVANDIYPRRDSAKKMAKHLTDKIRKGEYKIEVL